MSKIIIREFDNTKPGLSEYANFSVVVPGYIKDGTNDKTRKGYGIDENNKCVFDNNGIFECNSQTDFKNYVGLVAAESENEVFDTHFGNQIAYELLGLGYTVLFKGMRAFADEDETKYDSRIRTLIPVGVAPLESADFWNSLKDRAEYDFRYIISGMISDNLKVNEEISKIANYVNTSEDTGRGDIIALLDVPEKYSKTTESGEKEIEVVYSNLNSQKANIAGIQEVISISDKKNKYCAFFAPFVEYDLSSRSSSYMEEFGNNMKFPASFHYLACAAKSMTSFAEWYAVAGYTRGVSDLKITGVGAKFGDAAVNILQPRAFAKNDECAVNLIAKVRDQYLLWGNRTALTHTNLDEEALIASDFLNIRQLCCTLKKQIYIACRQLTFDPNSDVLWINFKNKLRPILEKMKNDQGINDYAFVKIKDTKKATLSAQIRIVPIEAVEDFCIDILLEDSLEGVTVGEE